MRNAIKPQTYIRAVRKARGLTLHKFADMLGTTPQTISRLETGEMRVSLEWLYAIATALGTQPHLLLVPVDGVPAEDVFLEVVRVEFIRSRRAVPDMGNMPLALLASAGQMAELFQDAQASLRPWSDVVKASAAVAAAAMRIGVDGEKMRLAAPAPHLVENAA